MPRDPKRERWPYLPSQGTLLLSALAILAGTALPWAIVLGRPLWGSPGAIAWTLWAGLVTLAASAVRWRAVVVFSALAGGATAGFFAVWQTFRIVDRCLSFDCLPGPGLGLLLAGGGAALWGACQLAYGWRS